MVVKLLDSGYVLVASSRSVLSLRLSEELRSAEALMRLNFPVI